MLKAINYINKNWNQLIYWFHNTSVKINFRLLVVLSIWAYDKLTWELPDDWKLINGITLKEYKLKMELENAYHQVQYYANFAHDLQWQILEQAKNKKNRTDQTMC